MGEMPSCQHARLKLIAKDRDAEYVECLDCGALLEAGELALPAPAEPSNTPLGPFHESLSDA